MTRFDMLFHQPKGIRIPIGIRQLVLFVAGQFSLRRFEVVNRQSDLFEVVAALHSSGRFARLLNRGQEQSDENPNDGNHDQQFDERHRSSSTRRGSLPLYHDFPPSLEMTFTE